MDTQVHPPAILGISAKTKGIQSALYLPTDNIQCL